MDLRIIMILGALFGFIYAMRVKQSYARIITWTMIVAVSVAVTNIVQLKADGYYLFALTLVGVIVYGISYPDFSTLKKLVLISCGLLTVVPVALLLAQNPDPREEPGVIALIQLGTAVAQIAIFAYGAKTDVKALKEEMGFLIILTADALVRLIGGVMFFVLG